MYILNSRIRKFTSINAFAVILISVFFLLIFAPSSFATSNVIDFTTTPGFGASGFCANQRQWEYGSLKYIPYSWNVSSHITKSFTSGNYNQITFNSIGCSNTPWGVYSIGLNVRSAWGLTDGKYINIDLVSNNSGLPFFNGSVVYAYESGTGAVIPGFIDKRTYDVKMQKNTTTWLSGREQEGSEYSMQYDEIEIYEGQPSYLHHIQFSIPYHASEFTSNGVSNLQIGTSQWISDVGNDGSHFQEFGQDTSPLFYIESSSVNSTTMFWIYVSVSDEPEFTSEDSWQDQWSADYQATQDYINSHANSANSFNSSLNGISFNVLNPFALWFTSFVDTSCYDFSTITGWFGLGNQRICSPWSSDIRNVITPIVSSLTGIIIFGFVVNWLKGKEDIERT